jgi:hypothetical protein
MGITGHKKTGGTVSPPAFIKILKAFIFLGFRDFSLFPWVKNG